LLAQKGLEKFYSLVESFENLPSIGKKSALRLTYHIVYENAYNGVKLAHSIENAIASIKKCVQCGSMCENEICDICVDEYRDKAQLCLVQSAKDIFNIEESKQYTGKYFVLEELEENGIIQLKKLITKNKTKNLMFAITPSIANDAFILYIEEQLKEFDLTFTKIAQGVPTGVSLENVDILSLSKAIKDSVKI
jgi:recombination protein RecR